MGLLECASNASAWKGFNYYNEKRVKNLTEIQPEVFTAKVNGSSNKTYLVIIDVAHPRKSECTCPKADGKRVICKHMIATYFTAHPEEAERFYQEYLDAQAEAEQYQERIYDKTQAYIEHMKKSDLQQALIDILFCGPEWQFERFVKEHDID